MTHELPCHLCNTYHAEREGCARTTLGRNATMPMTEALSTFVATPALDKVIEYMWKDPKLTLTEVCMLDALKEIRALLGGKSGV